jgi:hypothetical protein
MCRERFRSVCKQCQRRRRDAHTRISATEDRQRQQIPTHPRHNQGALYFLHHRTVWLWQIYLHQKIFRTIQEKYKNRPIYLFSSLPSDESLDKIKPKRFRLDDSLHEDPIKVAQLEESMCIFDDIDVISNKKIREAVYDILNQILEIGRHYKIDCICTNHLPTNGKETRRILNEAHTVVYFPHIAGGK